VFVVLLAAGLLFSVSAETAGGTQLRSDRPDPRGLIAAERARLDAREQRVSILQAEIDAETAPAARTDSTVRALREEADRLALPAGLVPMQGPGLVVTLTDAPPDAPYFNGPDDLVVHQQDVQAVVNALWSGGAEAMMLQDQRVISTSAVRCVGNTLILQGRVYAPPYIVTAIGDVAGMQKALADSPQVAIYRQFVDAVGLGYDVKSVENQYVPAYQGSVDLRYATLPPGSDQ
jgi:uncharacterized protein YlxW (UPF0749 family)